MIDDLSNRICYTILMCVFMYVYTYMYLNEYQRILFAFNSDMLIPCKIICMLNYKCLMHANLRGSQCTVQIYPRKPFVVLKP